MNAPQQIELTPEERGIYDSIPWDLETIPEADAHEVIPQVCDRMATLTDSLVERKAIPQERWAFFADPELNVGGRGKSRKDVFVRNGTSGGDISRHVHFLPWLHYFIDGPLLPAGATSGFCEIVEADRGTSGMLLDEVCSFVRSQVRRRGLDRTEAAEQFFRLAHEIKRPDLAEPSRKAALSVR